MTSQHPPFISSNSPVKLQLPASDSVVASNAKPLEVRFLESRDLPALIALEKAKWDDDQAASGESLQQRIEQYPHFSIGAFDPDTGVALASLFLKPIVAKRLLSVSNWYECVEGNVVSANECSDETPADALFGISLSSRSAAAVEAIQAFYWPHALKAGWRNIYLGSPVPGWCSWLSRHPHEDLEDYVRRKRNGLPLDPQLRYYYRRGFKKIIRVVPNYFPHPESLDSGVIIAGRIPLAAGAFLWKRLPISWLCLFRNLLFRLL